MTASIFPAKASSKSSSKKNKSSLLNLPSSSGNTLLQKLSMREKLKNDPFSQSAFGSGNSNSHSVESASSIKTSSAHLVTPKNHDPQEAGAGLALLGSYASSEDD